MCGAHRDDVIKELRCRLKAKDPVICVSTQLIEAGVDISLECVIRDVAGLDSIYQAAGRCNRHGEFGEAKDVYVVNIAGENLDKLPDIKEGARITMRLFDEGRADDIDEYYKHYFYARRGVMDYPVSGGSLYDLLSLNNQGKNAFVGRKNKQGAKTPALWPAIRSAAGEFYVIDRGRTEVVVPYGESMGLVSDYCKSYSDKEKRRLVQKLGKYSVSLYQYQLDALNGSGALSSHGEQGEIIVLANGFYDERFGVNLEGHHEFLYV